MVLTASGAAEKADLKTCTARLRGCAGLLRHGVFVESEMVEDFGGVARENARDNRQGMGSHGRAMAATSAAKPPAPLGSLALKRITQARAARLLRGLRRVVAGDRWA